MSVAHRHLYIFSGRQEKTILFFPRSQRRRSNVMKINLVTSLTWKDFVRLEPSSFIYIVQYH